jgi:HEAT repeat protein
LLVVCVLVLAPRQGDFVEWRREIVRFVEQDLLGIYRADGRAPAYTKHLSLTDLKHMLASGSPALRASAVQALGERREDEVVPILARLLAETDQVDTGGGRGSISELSKIALNRKIRSQIIAEPGNVRQLIPYIAAAMQGPPQQRRCMIEVLGDIEEPLARDALMRIAAKDDDAALREAAQSALKRIDSQKGQSRAYAELRSNQQTLVVGLAAIVGALVVFLLYGMVNGKDRRLALLSLIPALLCAGFAYLVTVEFTRGKADATAIDRAIHDGSGVTLRTVSYQDETDFPGDSYVVRHLVRTGDIAVVKGLDKSNSVEPDDFDALKKMTSVRRDWVLARILVSKLGNNGLMDLAKDEDPETRLIVVTGLAKTKVTHDRIVSALELLAEDPDDRIKEKALEALAGQKGCPVWPPYATGL